MKHIKFVFIIGLVFLFSLSFVSASEYFGSFKKSSCIELVQGCSNCTFNNLTSIIQPNGTQLFINENMTKSNTLYYYTFCDTSTVGEYTVNGFGDLNGRTEVWSYKLLVTTTGYDSQVETGYGAFFLLGLVIVLFYLFVKIETTTLKWTFFIFAIMMIFLGLNVISIGIQNAAELAGGGVASIFDMVSSLAIYAFYLSAGLLLFFWIFSVFDYLGSRQTMKQAESIGQPINFNNY